MKNNVCIFCFLQGTAKCINQMMGQFTDKSYRIREQNLLTGRQFQNPGRRIQCGKQLVFFQNLCSRKSIQQRRLTRIGITHDGNHRRRLSAAPASCHFSVPLHLFQFPVQLGNSALNQASVHLQLLLPRSPGSDTAAQSGQ